MMQPDRFHFVAESVYVATICVLVLVGAWVLFSQWEDRK